MSGTESAGDILADLPAALHLAAFEQVSGRLFQPVGRLPEWMTFENAAHSIDLVDRFPMLEIFLPECEPRWQGVSDIWTEPDQHGRDQYLQAVAAQVDGRRFLVVKSLPESLYTYQQLAHDLELANQQLESLGRELERKRHEAERATQAKSEFLARMSHEIRTPLNAVIGMADVLLASSVTPEQRRCVEVSQRNSLALLNLINDILDISKVESGKVQLEIARFDVREVVAGALEVVATAAAQKGLSLHSAIAADVPESLMGDPNRLRQILVNLLGNSLKFTHKGRLEVRVCNDPRNSNHGRLRFGVSDTGIGIPPDKMDAIFESFTQADSSTTRKYGGTGLGLSISKQFVELMGGRIWVESAPGVGSTFFFTARFGMQVSNPDQSAAQTSLQTLDARAAGMKILLADDSEDNRFLILSYLKRTGSFVDCAENGAVAVQLFRKKLETKESYDVVLMDVEMPVMDGYTATHTLRELERANGVVPTPVLALTAHAFENVRIKGFEAGYTELLTKPIRHVALLEALARYAPGSATLAGKAPAVKILVEKGMEDVVPGYVERRREEVVTYRAALARGDMDAIRMKAHRMKGTGTGYGLPILTEMGGALEDAALAGDAAVLQTKIDELERYLDSVGVRVLKRHAGAFLGNPRIYCHAWTNYQQVRRKHVLR